MEYRYGSHTVYEIEYHFVWVTEVSLQGAGGCHRGVSGNSTAFGYFVSTVGRDEAVIRSTFAIRKRRMIDWISCSCCDKPATFRWHHQGKRVSALPAALSGSHYECPPLCRGLLP